MLSNGLAEKVEGILRSRFREVHVSPWEVRKYDRATANALAREARKCINELLVGTSDSQES